MKRHWDSKHKGMEMKYKIVHGVSGVDSLDSRHGFKRTTSSNNKDHENERVEKDLAVEDVGDENHQGGGADQDGGGDQGGGGDRKKRGRDQSDSEEEDENANQRKKRKENILDLLLKKKFENEYI